MKLLPLLKKENIQPIFSNVFLYINETDFVLNSLKMHLTGPPHPKTNTEENLGHIIKVILEVAFLLVKQALHWHIFLVKSSGVI